MLRLKFLVCGAFTTGHVDADGMLGSLYVPFGGLEKLLIRELRKILNDILDEISCFLCPDFGRTKVGCGRKVCKPFLQKSFDNLIYSLKHDYKSTLSYEGLLFTLLPWCNFLCVDLR